MTCQTITDELMARLEATGLGSLEDNPEFEARVNNAIEESVKWIKDATGRSGSPSTHIEYATLLIVYRVSAELEREGVREFMMKLDDAWDALIEEGVPEEKISGFNTRVTQSLQETEKASIFTPVVKSVKKKEKNKGGNGGS